MIRLNSPDRSFLVGTEAGSLLLRYAASRPADAPADLVALHVLNEHGEPENLIVAVAPALKLVAEVTDEDFGPEPENTEATVFLRSRLDATAQPETEEAPSALVSDGS